MRQTDKIYPADFEQKVGFDSVRLRLKELCDSEPGRRRVDRLSFSSDRNSVVRLLRQTDEMAKLISAKADIPSDPLHDIAPRLLPARAEGSFLTAEDLYKLLSTLRTLDAVRRFFCQNKSGEEEPSEVNASALSECFAGIVPFPWVISDIDSIIDRTGGIRDSASPRLMELRRQIASAQASMSAVMSRVLARASAAGAVDKDTAPAMRDGRLCIPVEASHKREVNGIIHDRSSTGKTIFIEPSELVEAGNRLRELELDEYREQIVILTEVTSRIRPLIPDILASIELLAVFDFIRAKARFAIETDAQMPVVEKKPEIDWFHAVHPVLLHSLRKQGREVVPLDIRLDAEHRILIISGPNAGGKSVTLKTVGIVQYMLQCGLLPTIYSNSHVGIFDKIFIDIGDEQSMENDLSTYSSHLRNMKHFLLHADSHTLVLADEMGSGTEPQIGGALAQAILLKLNQSKVMGIITTHYHNLKTLAESTPGFVNGAMLYDRQQLRPLFQLSIGSAGSSFALEIAAKTGLPRDVVESAKEIVGSDYVKMDKYLLDIARDRKYWSNKRLNIREKEQKLDRLLEKYEDNADHIREQRRNILNEAKRQAREIMETANARIEGTIRAIREADAEKERTRQLRRELEDYRKSLDKDDALSETALPRELRPQKHKSRKAAASKTIERKDARQLEVGDFVRMEGSAVTGKIISIENKQAQVAFGALRTSVPLSKLSLVNPPKESSAPAMGTSTYSASRDRQLNFRPELDVRGMRAEEALRALTYFLDDALQFSASRVRILHGTGHGILREVIRQQLKATPGVTHFADEDVRFGGAGITVVDLN